RELNDCRMFYRGYGVLSDGMVALPERQSFSAWCRRLRTTGVRGAKYGQVQGGLYRNPLGWNCGGNGNLTGAGAPLILDVRSFKGCDGKGNRRRFCMGEPPRSLPRDRSRWHPEWSGCRDVGRRRRLYEHHVSPGMEPAIDQAGRFDHGCRLSTERWNQGLITDLCDYARGAKALAGR